MRSIVYLLTFFVAVLLCCQATAQDGDDAKKIQGAWEITELIVGGKKVPEQAIKGMRFVFEKDKLTIVPPAEEKPGKPDEKKKADAKDKKGEDTSGVVDRRTFTFKLDSKAKPAGVSLTALDGENKGVVSPGIYEFQGNTLRWCQSDDPAAKERPKEFASPDKSKLYLFTFKRAK